MGTRQRLVEVDGFIKKVNKDLERFTCSLCDKIYGVPTLARDCEYQHLEDEE